MRIVLLSAALLAASPAFAADLAEKLSDFVGYTVVDSKAIKGWHDDKDKRDGFEGCKPGRVITFSDNKVLTCTGYGQHPSSVRPTATLLSRPIKSISATSYDYKMVVGDEVYDMKP